mmetsp:Transcript_31394/g.76597  ORF Transcript_31394/g.76597 Transcript_31394/m.76597 type:complete len:228 (+) Transcript_31394:97-780(+)
MMEYEDRDWTEFDFRHGLSNKNAEYKKRKKFHSSFQEAQARFDEIEEESETSMLVALLGALGVGFIPIGMHLRDKYRRKQKKNETIRTAAKGQAEFNKELKAYKAELQAELEEEEEDGEEEEEEEEAEEEEEGKEKKKDEENVEGGNHMANVKSGSDGKDFASQAESGDSLKENKNDSSQRLALKAKVVKFECRTCRKSYKSEKQLENHFASKAHIKAVKKAGKKKR